MSSFEWRLLYPTARCSALDFYHSDHRPICINLQSSACSNLMPTYPPTNFFRLEAMWTREAECEEVIAVGWHGNIPGLPSLEKFRLCSNNLHHWAKKKIKSATADYEKA